MKNEEKRKIKSQINELIARKDVLIDRFIGACEEINEQIRILRKELKEGKEK